MLSVYKLAMLCLMKIYIQLYMDNVCHVMEKVGVPPCRPYTCELRWMYSGGLFQIKRHDDAESGHVSVEN